MWRRVKIAFLRFNWVAPSIYALSLLLFTADYITDQFEHHASSSHSIPAFIRGVQSYRSTTRAGYRKPRVHFVRLITFQRGKEPDDVFNVPGNQELSIVHLCNQRRLLAMLLNKLENDDPALIAIDKFFRPNTCPPGDESTAALQSAIEAVSRTIPVIVGEDDVTPGELQERNGGELTEMQEAGFKNNNVLLEPTLVLGGNVQKALLTVGWGVDKIPIQWKAAIESTSNISDPVDRLTLSMATAKQYDASAQSQTRFSRLLQENTHPYTGLIREHEFPQYSAIDLICAKHYSQGMDWRNQCHPTTSTDSVFRGHIAVIGEYSRRDVFQTDFGLLPGVVLQANYIEALLDDRYFKSFNKAGEFVIGLIWFALVWLIFEATESPLRGLIYSIALSTTLWWILFYLLIQEWGYYLTVAAPGCLLLVGKALDSFIENVKRKKEEHAQNDSAVTNAPAGNATGGRFSSRAVQGRET